VAIHGGKGKAKQWVKAHFYWCRYETAFLLKH
jgi:hypothetical protein